MQEVVWMPITLRRKVVKIGGSLRLTVPPEIAQLLKIKEGDEIEFLSNNGDILIRKAKAI
jgi:AbrB family looped-hinge helix DNA binding protein